MATAKLDLRTAHVLILDVDGETVLREYCVREVLQAKGFNIADDYDAIERNALDLYEEELKCKK